MYKRATQRLCFIGFSSASFFIVGVGIVLPAWIAFHAGGSSLVGLVLLTSSVAGFVLAPLSGYIVDRHSRLTVTAAGQAIRAGGLFVLAFVQVLPEGLERPLLVLSAILGAFGYALLAGAMSGLLQSIIPESERMTFNMRLSFFNQAGLAIGTGAAGYAIDRLGSTRTAVLAACIALIILPLLGMLTRAPSGRRLMKGLTLLSASREAFRYLLNEPQSLSAAVTVGLAFAVIQITNLLLPGFVIHSLGGGSDLFGMLEMTAAIAGMAALAIAGIPAFARKMTRATATVLAGAAAALIVLSFVTNPLVAIVLYALAGMLWNLARAAANGHVLTVVDSALIGRVQAFTTLLTGGLGGLIFLLPTLLPNATEAHLYMACGVTIFIAMALVGLWTGRRRHTRI
ncbi:MFS transporter [Bradyrhizobium sp. CCBAU 21360]|uniref:MFS transporter n=1 Tax=Bradyrhizobium sp. CCBAU 21360 TaxID=1325081 RepID=UPI0023059A43|nr:MFS transporter [Bradyrhizobium sp. CCBAU 21360]MDA9448239.1 MFS transporter [Bradyrhizobium sp. CCBAU 21360]